MLEIIKEASVILKDLPDLAIWILLGILFYKVFIIGGLLSFGRFVVNKLHDYLKDKNTPRPKNVSLSGKFICHDGTYNRFLLLVDRVKAHGDRMNPHLNSIYLHSRDVEWMEAAIEKQIIKDESLKKKSKVEMQ